MSNGVPQASVILMATIAFASVAWQAGMVSTPPLTACEHVQVVQYLPMIEPAPLIQSPPLGWPVLDRQRADDAPIVEQTVAKDDDADEALRRHRRRRWRRR